VASLSQGRTAAAQCGLFTHKSVPVIFEPPCICHLKRIISTNCSIHTVVPPDDGPRYARNMYRLTKYTKSKSCIKLVFLYTRTQLYFITIIYWSSCKVPVILVRFHETWTFSAYFRKMLKSQISIKSVKWDGQTGRHVEAKKSLYATLRTRLKTIQSAHVMSSLVMNESQLG